MSIYSYTFKSVILKSVKIKMFSKSVKMIQIIISDNICVILESVKIESVKVDRHPLSEGSMKGPTVKD